MARKKSKHIMRFKLPEAIRKLELILEKLSTGARMTKHDMADYLGVVHRTSQAYLSELRRRQLIHVCDLVRTKKKGKGGTATAVWAIGPGTSPPMVNGRPAIFGPPVPRSLRKGVRRRAPRKRTASEVAMAAVLAKRRAELPGPFRDTWQAAFWGEKGVSKNEDES